MRQKKLRGKKDDIPVDPHHKGNARRVRGEEGAERGGGERPREGGVSRWWEAMTVTSSNAGKGR